MTDGSNLSLLVDASGNPCAGTFGAVLPTVNIAGVTTGVSAGVPVGGLGPSARLTPLTIDPFGSLNIRPGTCPTWSATSVTGVGTTTGAGKTMLSIYNGNSSVWQRIAAIYAQCPPQINTQGGLLGIGSGTSYVQIPFGVYRIAGHTGGTDLSAVAADPADDSSLTTLTTVKVGATLQGRASVPSYAWDAAYNGSLPIGPRPDMCMKTWTLPPGAGLAIVNLNAIGTNVNFLMSITCAQNIA